MTTTPAGDPDRTLRVDSGAVFARRPAGEGQFAPGTIVAGRYRVASLLGSGGMGEVYRPEDTKLGQTVALKFLPERLARDPLLLGRLHEEVRLGLLRCLAHDPSQRPRSAREVVKTLPGGDPLQAALAAGETP